MSTLIGTEPAPWPTNSQVDWRRVDELLKAAQYDQVATLLLQGQTENEQKGDIDLANVLAATYQICLALAASQTEIEWYRRIYSVLPYHPWEQFQNLLGEQPNPSSPSPKKLTISLPELTESSTALAIESPFSLMLPFVPIEVSATTRAKMAPGKSSCRLTVSCLGPFRVYQNEKLVEKWNGHKCKLLLKYLILHRDRPVHREILMDLFWPDADLTSARKNLHQAMFNLRQTLQIGCPNFTHILFEDSCYYLNPDLEVNLDSEVFIRHYQNGQQLERQDCLSQAIKEYELADSLYKGEFLAEDLYEDWTNTQRENLQHTYLDILGRLSQFYFEQKQFPLCITFCQKILALDNCHEEAHCQLMRCYYSQGQRHLALRQYHLCADVMERELAVLPAPATVELYRQIQGNYIEYPK